MPQPSEHLDEPGSGLDTAAANGFLALIDELEQYVAEATRVPLTGKALLDEDELYAILDQIRRHIPGEIRRALEIVAQEEQLLRDAHQRRDTIIQEAEMKRDRILEDAENRRDIMLAASKQEAEKRVADAKREAQRLISETEVLQEAKREAEEILQSARKAAKELQDGADQYAEATLARLEKTLGEMLAQARQGRQFLLKLRKEATAKVQGKSEQPGQQG